MYRSVSLQKSAMRKMINLIDWWKELPWQNKALDELASPDSLRRKRALTWKELFFRDRAAVLMNFIPLVIFTVLIIISLFD